MKNNYVSGVISQHYPDCNVVTITRTVNNKLLLSRQYVVKYNKPELSLDFMAWFLKLNQLVQIQQLNTRLNQFQKNLIKEYNDKNI